MSCKRVSVVTGANKGIGFAIVRALCKQFDGVVYLTARNLERGEEAVKALEKEGLRPKFHLLDISDQKSIDTLKDSMVKQYGGVDVFVHNAAIAYKVNDLTPFSEQARITISVNFECTRKVCNTFLPVMKANGRLVILSSGATMFAMRNCSEANQKFFRNPDVTEGELTEKLNEFVKVAQTEEPKTKGFANTAYGMSKLGVTVFTRILGRRVQQLEAPNVLVNCCCPGWVKTDMAGPKAPLTPDQGAETPVMLALLPVGSTEPNGQFVKEKKVLSW